MRHADPFWDTRPPMALLDAGCSKLAFRNRRVSEATRTRERGNIPHLSETILEGVPSLKGLELSRGRPVKVGMYGLRAGPSGSVWASSDAGGTGRRDGFNCQQVFGAAELLAILLCGAWQPFCASGGCTPTHPFVNASVCSTAARSRWLRHGLCWYDRLAIPRLS